MISYKKIRIMALIFFILSAISIYSKEIAHDSTQINSMESYQVGYSFAQDTSENKYVNFNMEISDRISNSILFSYVNFNIDFGVEEPFDNYIFTAITGIKLFEKFDNNITNSVNIGAGISAKNYSINKLMYIGIAYSITVKISYENFSIFAAKKFIENKRDNITLLSLGLSFSFF